MITDSKSMSLVPDSLDQPKGSGGFGDHQWIGLSRDKDFIQTLRQSDDLLSLDSQFPEGRYGARQLTFATIDEDQIGKRVSLG